MSITRERLNEIAHIASRNTADKLSTFSIDDEYVEIFAHALLKAVEAEMEVVGYREGDPEGIWFIAYTPNSKAPQHPLIALPLVKEE